MGEAVQNLVVSASDQFASTRGKTRRTKQAGRYTGNLIVFADAQAQPSKLTELTVEKNSAPGHPNTHEVADGLNNDSADHLPQTGSDSARRIASPSTITGRRNKVGIVILLSLASGVVVGTIWTSNAKTPSADTMQSTSVEPLAPEAVHTKSIPPTESAQVVSDTNPAETQLMTAGKIVAEKMQKIQSLHTQNKDLLAQVNILNSESAELNSELLRLERSIAEMKLQSQPVIETKTVYNFVNRPTGNDFASQNDINITQNDSDQGQDQLYYESQLYSDDQYNYEEEQLIDDEQEQRYIDNQEGLYDAAEDSYNYYAPDDQQQIPLETTNQYSAEGQPYDESENLYDDDPQNLIPYE